MQQTIEINVKPTETTYDVLNSFLCLRDQFGILVNIPNGQNLINAINYLINTLNKLYEIGKGYEVSFNNDLSIAQSIRPNC